MEVMEVIEVMEVMEVMGDEGAPDGRRLTADG